MSTPWPLEELPVTRTATGIVNGAFPAPLALTLRLAELMPFGRPLGLMLTAQFAGVVVLVQVAVTQLWLEVTEMPKAVVLSLEISESVVLHAVAPETPTW